MSNARVLYINLTGVTCEMMKNLVLAGVAAAICDNRPYPAAVREVPSSFLKAADMEKIIASTKSDGNDEEPEAKRAKTTKMTVGEAISPKVDELNPLLIGRNSIENRSLSTLPDEYFGQFDAVVASRLSITEVRRISSAISKYHENQKEKHESNNNTDGEKYQNNTLFIVTDTFGLDGCAHLDFGASHTYIRELGKDKLSDPTKITPYVSMGDMLAVPLKEATGRWDKVPPRILVLHRLLIDYWSSSEYTNNNGKDSNVDEDKVKEQFVTYARGWMETHEIPSASLELEENQPMPLEHLAGIALHPEVCPVAAVLGGVLGNEVIKSLTRKGEPSNNVLMFSGLDGGCRIFTLHPAN